MSHPIRLLIHPLDPTYIEVTQALIEATREHSDAFTITVDQPGTVDHIGYHDTTISSVVWTQEPHSIYFRLTLRPERHEVFARLLRIALGQAHREA